MIPSSLFQDSDPKIALPVISMEQANDPERLHFI